MHNVRVSAIQAAVLRSLFAATSLKRHPRIFVAVRGRVVLRGFTAATSLKLVAVWQSFVPIDDVLRSLTAATSLKRVLCVELRGGLVDGSSQLYRRDLIEASHIRRWLPACATFFAAYLLRPH